MENDQSMNINESRPKSKRGGSREGAGRKLKHKEPRRTVSLGLSKKFAVERFLEWCDQNEIKGKQFDAILDYAKSAIDKPNNLILSASRFTMKHYSNPVSAGPGRTSSTGNDSLNTDYENISVPHVLSPNPEESFMVPVVGDSMKGIGIDSGNILVVESCSFAREGKIIVASVNDEIMVKRYELKNNRVFLYSENPEYPPIEIVEQTFSILGVVRSCINNDF